MNRAPREAAPVGGRARDRPARGMRTTPGPRRGRGRQAMRAPTRAQAKAAAPETLATGVQTLVVEPDEAGHAGRPLPLSRAFPQLAFTHIQRIVRKGELRIDGKRAKPNDRLEAGQKVRVPPLKLDQPRARRARAARTRTTATSCARSRSTRTRTCSSSTSRWGSPSRAARAPRRHVDGLLEALRDGGPEAAPRAPARQGHGGLPRGRQDALRRLDDGEVLPVAIDAQDLLGARRRRAAGPAGPHLDLPRQGGGREGDARMRSPGMATRARATR